MSHDHQRLASIASDLEPDALTALVEIAERLLVGQKQYGRINIDTDQRDWLQQMIEEQQDKDVYGTFLLIKLRRLARELDAATKR